MSKYEFEYKQMEFSKDGQLDELIALDRYAVPSYTDYKVNDIVVGIVDKNMGTKKVGTVTNVNSNGQVSFVDRFGVIHTVDQELLQKPLETKPHQLWERWAKGAASVEETKELKNHWENEFRWLFDGYRYSLGGRIQLMLGQEYVTGKRANLTAYNCFVIRSPYSLDNAKDQFIDVLDVAFYEASIMRRGGGVGTNITPINTVSGSGAKETDFIFYLDKSHKDAEELQDRLALGKLKGVTVVTDMDEFKKLSKDAETFDATDSVDNGLFDDMKKMVNFSYDNKKVAINFNPLRHRNAIVKGVNGRSSGSVSWMEFFALIARLTQQEQIDNVDFAEIFSEIVHLIIQGGSRRGALMLICNDDSPNIYKFMQRKKQMGYLSGANISVGVSDTFMENVKEAKSKMANLTTDEARSVDLWNVLIESAWTSAEPGIVWLERYNKESNSWYFHEIIATNPCGRVCLM